jgi:hypothetical protein
VERRKKEEIQWHVNLKEDNKAKEGQGREIRYLL